MTSISRRAVLLLLAATAVPSLYAANETLSRDDRKFVEDAAAGGMAEVELGKLAQQRGGSDEVKRFGERMVQDHSRAGDELKTLATGKGATPPAELKGEHRRHVEKLGKLNGAEFDREYSKTMVEMHGKTIALYQKQQRSGKDAELRAFAARTLPTVQQHHEAAKALRKT